MTSFFPNDITISYNPGPNLDPVKAILSGCPTPLKFVSCFLIKLLTIGSKLSLVKFFRFLISFLNSLIIFFDLSSINFKSSSLKFTSSLIIYLALLKISSSVFALFFKNTKDDLILVAFAVSILSMNEHYIKNINENDLYDNLLKYCEEYKDKIDTEKATKIKSSLVFLKNKAKTLEQIFNNAKYIINKIIIFNFFTASN